MRVDIEGLGLGLSMSRLLFRSTWTPLSIKWIWHNDRLLLTRLGRPFHDSSFTQRNRLPPPLSGGQRIRAVVGLRGPDSSYAQAPSPPRNILLQIQPLHARSEYSKCNVSMPVGAPTAGSEKTKLRPGRTIHRGCVWGCQALETKR